MQGDVGKATKKLGLSGQEQEMALEFFERGLTIHLTATVTLRNVVIIKSQWLIDALGKVIRDSSIHVRQENFQKFGLEKDAKTLFEEEEGIASRDLLEHLWYNDRTEFLIDLMKRTMLMSNYGKDKFLIPSLLKKRDDAKLSNSACLFNFSETFLPHGLFQRLVCLCVEYVERTRKEDDSIVICKSYSQILTVNE